MNPKLRADLRAIRAPRRGRPAIAARRKDQQHLLAVARRKLVGEAVAEVLVERGNSEVLRPLPKMPMPSYPKQVLVDWWITAVMTMYLPPASVCGQTFHISFPKTARHRFGAGAVKIYRGELACPR